MKIIDAHTHFYPQSVCENTDIWSVRYGEQYWGTLVGKRPDAKASLQSFPSEKEFLNQMDLAGVDRAIIQGWYWQKSHSCDFMNGKLADFLDRKQDRISAFISVNPNDTDHCLKTILNAKSMGFCGVGELHDGVQNFDFSSNAFDEIVCACAQENLPICIHITEGSDRMYMGKIPTATDSAIALARKHSNANFILAHWCGGEIFDATHKFDGLKNVFFDSAATPLTHPESVWLDAAKIIENFTVFGSDYPLRIYPRLFKVAEMSTLVSRAKETLPIAVHEKIFKKNILKIIDL